MKYKKFKIPKKTKGQFRTVYAPDPELLKAQRSQLVKFEKIYLQREKDYNMCNIAHGFIHGRSAVTGASAHIGYATTTMLDISDFFDSVSRKAVEEIVNGPVPDYCFVDGYLAQGFATSPILANIAILPVLDQIKTELDILGLEYKLTIYADDIQCSYNHSIDNFEVIIEQIVGKILANNDFKLNYKKTRTRQAKFGYRKILGINVGTYHIRATRRVMRKIRAAKHSKNGPSLGGLTTWSRCTFPKRYTA